MARKRHLAAQGNLRARVPPHRCHSRYVYAYVCLPIFPSCAAARSTATVQISLPAGSSLPGRGVHDRDARPGLPQKHGPRPLHLGERLRVRRGVPVARYERPRHSPDRLQGMVRPPSLLQAPREIGH